MTRTEELYAAVDTFNKVHEDWSNRPGEELITADYSAAFEAMVAVFEHGAIPANCRKLASAVFEFAAEMETFDQSDQVKPLQSLWAAREKMARIATQGINRPEEFRLESVKTLHEQGVSSEQIARMYGLVDDAGNGKSWLIEKELATPGSVIGADYVHPEQLKRSSQFDAEAQTVARIQETRAAEEPGDVAPETPEELFYQGVSIQQAARMLRMTEGDLQMIWDKLPRPRNDTEYWVPTATPAAEPEQAADDLTLKSDEELRELAGKLGVETRGRNRLRLIKAINEAVEINALPVEDEEAASNV